MNWRRQAGLLFMAAALVVPARLPAYTVEPQLLLLRPAGSDSSTFLRVMNRTLRPTAVEVVINEFRRDAEGRGVIGTEVENDFIVYPAQMILMPGDEASVEVRWIGASAIDAERAFALTTREVSIPGALPQQPEPSGDGVRIGVSVLMNYDVRLYVRPRGARPRVAIEAVTVRPQPEGRNTVLEVTLVNQGTAHHPLRSLSLLLLPLDPSGNPRRAMSVTVAASEIPGMNAALLAGGRRRLSISWPPGLPEGPVRVVLSE